MKTKNQTARNATTHLLYPLLLIASFYTAWAEDLGEIIELDTIVVTSQKTLENKQDVPISITALTGEFLEDYEMGNVIDLAQFLPSMDFIQADNHLLSLIHRGIGGNTTMNKIYTVSIDGVTLPYAAPNIGLDVRQIDVVRGSQGSLYGRNTLAGVVNVTTELPGSVRNRVIHASYGNYNTTIFQAAVGVPVSDNSGARIAFAYEKTDGYFENTFLNADDLNSTEKYSLNAKYRLTGDELGSITLTLIADQFDSGFDSYVVGGGLDTSNNEPGYNDGYLIAPIITWEKEFDSFKLKSISNYSCSNYGFLHDWDFSEYDVSAAEFDENTDSFSQEIRFEGELNQGANWLVGVYLLAEDLNTETVVNFGDDAGFWMMSPGVQMSQNSTIKTRNAALFGQFLYPVSDSFEITARLRLDNESRDLDWVGRNPWGPATEQSFSDSWFAILPSLSLTWKPVDAQLSYFSVSRGYKSGDYNNVQVDSSVVTEAVNPEYSVTYEAGYKMLLLENKMEVNVALFYVDWKDIQVDTPLPDNMNVYIKQNAAEAHSSGIEVEARALLGRGFEIYLGGNYMFEYEFDQFPNSPAGDLSQNLLPQTSEYKISLGSIYRHDSGAFVSVDVTHHGAKFFDEANMFEQGAYTLLNAKVGYEAEGWSVYLYGRNLTDEEYSVSMFSEAEMAGAPLQAGVKAMISF